MDWHTLISALALVLVIEGLVPFAKPSMARRYAQMLEKLNDGQLRLVGLSSIGVGVVVLWLASILH